MLWLHFKGTSKKTTKNSEKIYFLQIVNCNGGVMNVNKKDGFTSYALDNYEFSFQI